MSTNKIVEGNIINNQKDESNTIPTRGKKCGRGCLFFFLIVILLCILIFAFFIGGAVGVSRLFRSNLTAVSSTSPSRLAMEQIFYSGDRRSENKIALINVNGVIMEGNGSWKSMSNSNMIVNQLQEVIKDNDVKAVILYVNSPGGEITATDKIYHNIRKVQEKGKPVIALLGPVAASGGYYIAAPCNYIIANKMTITGSIGVIIANFNFFEFLKKIGVKDEIYKSKDMKDMLNPARQRTKKETEIVDALVKEAYLQFVKVVSNGRIKKNNKLTISYIEKSKIGDGRIFSGQQALKLGLVDKLGYFEDATFEAKKLAGIGDYKIIIYQKPFSFSELFSTMQFKSSLLNLDIPALEKIKVLDSGELFYMQNVL